MLSIKDFMGSKSALTLSEFFKLIREQRDWSQTDLAKVLKVDQSYISMIEGDRYKKPPLDTVKKLFNKVLTNEEKDQLMLVLYQEMDSYIQD